MSDREFLIPPRFFKSLTDEEAVQVVTTSRLTPELCARLWRMLDRQDEPPTSMTLYANSADIMRLWPALSPNASAPAAADRPKRAKRQR